MYKQASQLQKRTDFFNFSSLGSCAGWRKTVTTDTPASPNTGREYVLLIKVSPSQFAGVKVSGVFGAFRIAIVTLIDHRVKQIRKNL